MCRCAFLFIACLFVCLFHTVTINQTHPNCDGAREHCATHQLWITLSHAEEDASQFQLEWGDDGSLSSHKSFPSFPVWFVLMTSCSSVWVDALASLVIHTHTNSKQPLSLTMSVLCSSVLLCQIHLAWEPFMQSWLYLLPVLMPNHRQSLVGVASFLSAEAKGDGCFILISRSYPSFRSQQARCWWACVWLLTTETWD